MKTTRLGSTSISVSAIGLGAMPLSLDNRPTEEDAIRVIHRALDLGVTLIDTADAYCIDENDKHHNERLIAKALASYSGDTSQVIIATKGGLMRPKGDWTTNGDPKHIQKTIQESYEALGGKHPISLWQLHAVDDRHPIKETLKPVAEAVRNGLIRFVGVSNFSVEEIKEAQNVIKVVSVQNQYNPWCRSPEKDGVLAYCEKEGLTFLPWSPVGGSHRVKRLNEMPKLRELASGKKVSPQALVLAWLRAKSPCILPIPGATRVASIEDSVASLEISLTSEEVKFLDKTFH